MCPKVLLSLAVSYVAVEGSHLHEGLHEHLGQRLAEALDALKVVIEECLPRQRRNPRQPLLRWEMLARVQKEISPMRSEDATAEERLLRQRRSPRQPLLPQVTEDNSQLHNNRDLIVAQ